MSTPGTCPELIKVIKTRMDVMGFKSLEELSKRFKEPERIMKSLTYWASGNYPPGGKNRDELCEILQVPIDSFERAGHNVYNFNVRKKDEMKTVPIENENRKSRGFEIKTISSDNVEIKLHVNVTYAKYQSMLAYIMDFERKLVTDTDKKSLSDWNTKDVQ